MWWWWIKCCLYEPWQQLSDAPPPRIIDEGRDERWWLGRGNGVSIGYLGFSATPPSKEHQGKEGIRFQEYPDATSLLVYNDDSFESQLLIIGESFGNIVSGKANKTNQIPTLCEPVFVLCICSLRDTWRHRRQESTTPPDVDDPPGIYCRIR